MKARLVVGEIQATLKVGGRVRARVVVADLQLEATTNGVDVEVRAECRCRRCGEKQIATGKGATGASALLDAVRVGSKCESCLQVSDPEVLVSTQAPSLLPPRGEK
jgi:hypothetical protein